MAIEEFETTEIWLRSMFNINKELDFEREKVNQSIERIEKLEKEKEKLFNILDKITNPTYKQVLHKRYIQGKRWEDIERELNYAEQHIGEVFKVGTAYKDKSKDFSFEALEMYGVVLMVIDYDGKIVYQRKGGEG